MEIGSFLRLSPRRLVALTTVGAIGAAAGLAVADTAPEEFTTSATIRVGDIFAPAGNNFEINPYALGVVGVLREGPVQRRIAALADVPDAAVDSLTASQPDEGGPVLLTVTSTDIDESLAIIDAAANVGLNQYSERLLERATARKLRTQANLDAATAALLEFETRTTFGYGLADAINQIQLRVLPEAIADINNPDLTTAVAQARVDETEKRLAEARLLLPELTPLAQEFDQSSDEDGSSSRDQLIAQDAQGIISTSVDSYIVEGDSVAVARMPGLIRGAVAGGLGLAGLLLGAFLARALRLERRRARGRRPATRSDDQGPGALSEHVPDTVEAAEKATEEPVKASRSSKKATRQTTRKKTPAPVAATAGDRATKKVAASEPDTEADGSEPVVGDAAQPAAVEETAGPDTDADSDTDTDVEADDEKVPVSVSAGPTRTPPRRPSKATSARQTGRKAAGARRSTRKS